MKYKAISCADIIPNKTYLCKIGNVLEPVKIECEETQGWLRGYVKVHGFRNRGWIFSAKAYIKVISTGKLYEVELSRESDEPWKFKTIDRQISLLEMTPEWLCQQKLETQKNIDALANKLAVLNML